MRGASFLESLDVTHSEIRTSITSRDYACIHNEAHTVAWNEVELVTSFVRCEEGETIDEHWDDLDGDPGVWGSTSSSFVSSEETKEVRKSLKRKIPVTVRLLGCYDNNS